MKIEEKRQEITESKMGLLSQTGVSTFSDFDKEKLAKVLIKELKNSTIGFNLMNTVLKKFQNALKDIADKNSNLSLNAYLTIETKDLEKTNLITLFRNNNTNHINQTLNQLILVSIALSSYKLVEINYAMMEIISGETPILQYDSEKADEALSRFLGTEKIRCLRSGYHGPFVLSIMTDFEYQLIRNKCLEIKQSNINTIKNDFISELNKLNKKNVPLENFENSETLHDLQRAYQKCPYLLINSHFKIKEQFKTVPSVGIEENHSAIRYYSSKSNG